VKIIAKVIDDNGYKIELIRPLKDTPMTAGTKVEVEVAKEQVDLIRVFDGLLDEDTKNAILDKFSEAKKEVKKAKKSEVRVS
jgi:predicted CoA-binding protein